MLFIIVYYHTLYTYVITHQCYIYTLSHISHIHVLHIGGLFTTVEGLLNKIKTNLRDNNPFAIGDSTTLHHSSTTEISETKLKFIEFMNKLDACIGGKLFPFTIVLRDPLGNSFISAPLG